MSELRQPRIIFSLVVIAVGLVSIGWTVRSILTGAPEWRPGAQLDSLLLTGAITTMLTSGVCLIPAPDASVPIPRWRKVLGLVTMGLSVALLVWLVARMG
jgi:hypothetical protein